MAIRSSNSDPTLARAVGFASVQIREYPRILGDNPSVTSGPPITLSWEYDDEAGGRCSIDEWEGQRCRERRTREEFRVPEAIRTGWVLSAGHSTTEIRDIVLDIQKEKKVRRYSMDRSSLGDKADVMAEESFAAGGHDASRHRGSPCASRDCSMMSC